MSATAELNATPALEVRAILDFVNSLVQPSLAGLFDPQEITITSSETIKFAPNLPVSFELDPKIVNGNIQLEIRNVKFSPGMRPLPPEWAILNPMINKFDISIALINNNVPADKGPDLLVLTGMIGGVDDPAAGNWISTLVPGQGTWSSRVLEGSKHSPVKFSWIFLLTHNNGEAPETVILNFETDLDHKFKLCSSFPSGWKAKNAGIPKGEVVLTLISPDPMEKPYCLTAGIFSGGLNQLVCQGVWNPSSSSGNSGQAAVNGVDGGTWTGTSGGPVSVPPSPPTI